MLQLHRNRTNKNKLPQEERKVVIVLKRDQIMVMQSLQWLKKGPYHSNHMYKKAYQNQVTDFITINHFLTINKDLTYSFQNMSGNSQD
jgi:hypothetical protein